MEKSHVVTAEEAHHQKKNRNFLYLVLALIGVIILLASIFLMTVIYRTIKSGKQHKNLLLLDSNYTDFSSICLYGSTECEFGAICTEENQCQCQFNCSEVGERIPNPITGEWYSNQCRLDEAKCKLFYEKNNLTCSTINCSHGAKCAIDNHGLPRCYCPKNCDEYVRKISSNGVVCGSDQQTYETICELNRRACEKQENIQFVHVGKCQDCQGSNCTLNDRKCDVDINCSLEYRPVCANNLHDYSNECHMRKYACQLNINLTKLHDGRCTSYVQQRLRQGCLIENGTEVCRCLFNCSLEKNEVCASNGVLYRNLCELQRERCIRGENFQAVNNSFCCGKCPYGRCKQQLNGSIQCICEQCPTKSSEEEFICGDNGITYPSKCHLEYDACTTQIDIKANHMGQCNHCQNVICPFHAQCQLEEGNYTCVCPTRDRCPSVRTDSSYAICGSNQELFYSQCEMDVRSCELQTHLYTIAPHHCTQERDQFEYNQECGYDEPLFDLTLNRHTECDTMERCPLNSYCNKQANRCCVKVITALMPYRMCLVDGHCGRNMICVHGFCQCVRDDLMPARHKRECISVLPYLPANSTCHTSPFGCCRDNLTVSLTIDRHGCPEYCNCDPTGSLRTSCDPKTNSCYCRPTVTGNTCSYCENGYWAFSRIFTHNNTGCTPCGCHPYGSVRKDCSQEAGQCFCHSYTTGRRCEKCLDSSLMLTEHGCVNFNQNHRRRRQRTCRDFRCLFEGICEMFNNHPRCTCDQMICTKDEQHIMNICASDGQTYKSKCEIKRQQCLKQYEILPMYPGVCHSVDEDVQLAEDVNIDYSLQTAPIDSKRCMTDLDCGENMVCLSEFCECAKQKYQRISGPRCIMPQFDFLESKYPRVFNTVRHTSTGLCLQENLCENHARCQDQPDGSFQCLCTFGWRGRYCNEKIDITIPRFHRQSYLQLNVFDVIRYIDLIFTIERRDGVIFHTENKSAELYLIISIRNQTLEFSIRSDQSVSTIPLSDSIDLHAFIRLQIRILYNEIQIQINDQKILSRFLSFEILLKNNLSFGRISDLLNSLYDQPSMNEGFQGCIQKLSINEREIIFQNSQLIAENIDQCQTNLCQTKSCQNEVRSSSIDRCFTKPCERNQQCVNIHPNNYLCICLNCSSNHRYPVGFHSNSYIKYLPLQPLEHTGRLKIEIWFLSESSAGLLIYSEHINSRKGYMKLFLQRRLVIFNLVIGTRSVSLSSRYPIELNQWHQCSLEIYGQKLTLILDQEPPVITYELFSSNILWPRSFTFFGHLPEQYRSNHSHLSEGFRGGIQKIILNNNQTLNDLRLHAIELFNITEYYGYPCQPNPCQSPGQCYQVELNNYTCQESFRRGDVSLELDGTIHAIYSYKPLNFNRNYFDLLVKTKYSYLSLTLVDGFVQFAAKVHINSSALFLKSKIRIDDGRWHRIQIERFRLRIIIKLDEHHRYQTVLSGKETEFDPNPSYIYIGGYHRLCGYDAQHCQSYRGCLKNVTIDNNSINLIDDEINQHRVLKQCHDFI